YSVAVTSETRTPPRRIGGVSYCAWSCDCSTSISSARWSVASISSATLIGSQPNVGELFDCGSRVDTVAVLMFISCRPVFLLLRAVLRPGAAAVQVVLQVARFQLAELLPARSWLDR